ncbi:MAG: 4-hydroxy-2-ketovalerate aldolase, partial [Helicobacter sp.]|nr:4-hydroxy-2-ketovalerate aldolase [Helicobacter sp.]
KKILILAPGNSLEKYYKQINSYIQKENPIIISLNFDGMKFKCDYQFFTNAKRFNFFYKKENFNHYIITSNIKEVDVFFILNYIDLISYDENEEIFDNCTTIFLTLLKKMDIEEVSIAGFDGFSSNKNDYYDLSIANNLNLLEKRNEDEKLKNILKREIKGHISLNFLTPSIYKECFNV